MLKRQDSVAEYVDLRYDYYTMAENNKKNQNRKMQIDSLLDYPVRKTNGNSGTKRSGASSAQKQNAGRTAGKNSGSAAGRRSTSGRSSAASGGNSASAQRSGNAVRRTGTAASSSRKTSASGTETEAQRRERLRRNRERQALRKKRRKRKKIIRMALAVIAVSALAAILITGGAAIHRYRVKKAEAEAAAAAAEEAARTLDTFRASEVLHLSFPTLTIKDSSSAEDSSSDGTDTASVDADGDGIPDETSGTDTTETADAAAGTSSDSSADSSEEQALSVSDFNQILSDLYEQNYVLVDVYSLAASGDSGFTDGSVQVPKGKKPLIISQMDCSYTAEDDGKADSLVLDSKSGKILCQYTETNENDGSTDSLTGAVDVIPCLENFISQHPDFSYNGARGIIGITGYRGLFGYTVEKDENVIAAPTVTISPSTQNITYSEDDETQNSGDGSGTTGTDTGTDGSGTAGTGTDESGQTGTAYTDGTGTDAYGTADNTYASATTDDTADGMFAFAYPDNPVITGILKNARTDRGLASVLAARQEGTVSEEDTTAENTDTSGTGGGTSGTAESKDSSSESSSVSSVSSSSSDSLTNNEQVSRNLQTCQAIISALRSSGWHFACNSYDLTSYGSQYDIMKNDVDQWEDVFSSILGTTDIMLFPKKTDIGDWGVYTADNQKYSYLSSLGFHYYFIENSGELTWAQVQPEYVRQGIHEIDSYADYLEVLK